MIASSQTAAVLLTSAPFGIPAPVFWMYVCGALILIIGLTIFCK